MYDDYYCWFLTCYKSLVRKLNEKDCFSLEIICFIASRCITCLCFHCIHKTFGRISRMNNKETSEKCVCCVQKWVFCVIQGNWRKVFGIFIYHSIFSWWKERWDVLDRFSLLFTRRKKVDVFLMWMILFFSSFFFSESDTYFIIIINE